MVLLALRPMICPFCNKATLCECIQNVITISTLLGKTLLRLSDKEKKDLLGENYSKFRFEEYNSQDTKGLILGSACIDKLNFKLKETWPIAEFNKRYKEGLIKVKSKRLGNMDCWEVLDNNIDETKFFIKKPFGANQPINTFFTNPSAFPSFDDYSDFTTHLLSYKKIEKINRLDLAVNYHKPYEEIRAGFDCKLLRVHKQYSEHFSQGGKDTGMYLGKGDKYVCVYDWAKKHNHKGDITRIEIILKNLPPKNLQVHQMSNFVKDIIDQDPFKQVELNKIDLHLESNFPGKKEKKRFHKFETLIEDKGYYYTRKKLEKKTNRNFHKQYGDFFVLNSSAYQQPTDALFKLDIKNSQVITKSLDASGCMNKTDYQPIRLKIIGSSKEVIDSLISVIEDIDHEVFKGIADSITSFGVQIHKYEEENKWSKKLNIFRNKLRAKFLKFINDKDTRKIIESIGFTAIAKKELNIDKLTVTNIEDVKIKAKKIRDRYYATQKTLEG